MNSRTISIVYLLYSEIYDLFLCYSIDCYDHSSTDFVL